MSVLFADDALLPNGWARDVLLEWNDEGTLTRVQAGAQAGAAPRAAGPVLPGMCNVHSHAFQRAMAGLAEFRGHPTDDFWTWREEMYRLVGRLEAEDIEAVACHLYIEMLKHGYTCVGEFHYVHNDREGRRYADPAELANAIVSAASASGIALTLMPVMYAHGGFGHRPLAGGQKRFASDPAFIVELLRELASWHLPSPLLRLGIAPHSVRAVDALLLTELLEAAREIDPAMPVHMHVSEQRAEVAQCLETHGTTPFAWVSDLVAVDERWCLIHATHLTAEERERAAASGACVGLCPTTEANLGDGIFDFADWYARGAPWSIGGDSHVSVSPFEELRALESSQRLKLGVRNVASTRESPDVPGNLWRGAAAGGARALGQPIGGLAQGSRADLVVLDAGLPHCESLQGPAILGLATFGGNSGRVRTVLVGGRVVIEEGRHPDEQEARDAYRRSLRRLRATS